MPVLNPLRLFRNLKDKQFLVPAMFEREVSVIVKFRPDRRKEQSFVREIGELLPEIRQLRGCLHFDLYRSIDSRDWFIHQLWENQQSYDNYWHSPEASRLRAMLNERSTSQAERWRLDAIPL